MVDQNTRMYEIINDPKILSKYESFDIFTKHFGNYKLIENRNDYTFAIKRKSDFLNKKLFITLDDQMKMIKGKQYKLNNKLKSSMRVNVSKAKLILKDLIQVTLSEPVSDILLKMKDTVKIIVDSYLHNPSIVSSITRICVHDYSTQQHLINVMLYCMGYAHFTGLSKEDIKLYGLIGLMHDVGKIGVPNYLLQAPRKLTGKEMGTIRKHPVISWKILKNTNFDERVRIAACEHHERIDGSGYPEGKTGEKLLEASKVLAIVDVFEALTTWRPYKEPIKPFKALQVIKQDVLTKKLDGPIFQKFAYSVVGMSSQSIN
ncbi:MAG: HD domain-containing protein [Desulfobacteraceae bacterium]|nr:HD domain-containing protein [Desulfobacteraceae bacterium]